MILRRSPYRGKATLDVLLDLAEQGAGGDAGGYRAEFIQMMRQASELLPAELTIAEPDEDAEGDSAGDQPATEADDDEAENRFHRVADNDGMLQRRTGRRYTSPVPPITRRLGDAAFSVLSDQHGNTEEDLVGCSAMNEARKLTFARMARSAIVMDIGGFRPPDDPRAIWFGVVKVGIPGEKWPTTEGKPMLPLCQVNLTELPFRPPGLDDVAFLSVFIGPDDLPVDEPNGSNWCLRTYRSLDELQLRDQPTISDGVKPFPMRPRVIDEDYPCYEDLPIDLLPVDDAYHDLFKKYGRFQTWWMAITHSTRTGLGVAPAGASSFARVCVSDRQY